MIEQALQLLFTGMITVFLVLGLVVLTGRLLIIAVNQWFKTAGSPRPKQRAVKPGTQAPIPAEIIAVLSATVEVVTEGKGRIDNIEQLPK